METATISVFSPDGKADTGLSIFFMCTSTSLFTSSTFYENLNISPGQTVMTTCNKTMISSYYRTNSIGLELWLPVIKHWYQALPGQTVLV
jgi:hypothetical protein